MSSNPEKYAKDILNGKIDVCEHVVNSVARHYEDLKKQRTEEFPFYFDPEAGLKVLKFFSYLVLWEGDFAGKRFNPQPWQSWVAYVYFGWKRVDNNKRRFKYAYIEVPRKNGKTSFMGALSLYHIMKDDENAPAVYFVATKYSQAMEAMKDAIGIAEETPELRKRLTLYKKSIECPANNGSMTALGSDSKTQDGLNPSMVVMDEYHAHQDNGMFVKMKTAFGMRSQPTMLIITTAGSNRAYPCYAFRNRCIEVLQSSVSKDEKHKVKRQEDLFAIIYTLNKEDDWKSEDTWIKCNPSWDIMNQIEFRDEAKTAMEFESDQIGFQNLRLNIWTDAEHVWIKDDDWMKCAGPVKTDEELKDIPCYGGIDFASSKDLNALVLNFPLSDGTRHIKCWFWIPQKKVFEKEDYVDYDVWRKQGLINVIPGDAVNHEDLAAEVLRILQRFNVIGLAYDPYGIGEATIQTMINQGFPVEKLDKWAQRTSEYQRPIRTLEEEIHLQRINHEGHPVLRWNLHNIVLFMDSYGGVKFNKSKVVDKIDGMVALAMAIGEEMSQPEEDQGNFYVL